MGVVAIAPTLESASCGVSIIPREQRRTAEGAESSSDQAHCSRGQSTPAQCQYCTAIHPYAALPGALALAMLVSISDGFCLEGLLGAILFSELDMLAAAGRAGRSR